MALTSPRLRRFYEAIHDLALDTDAMLASMLDGFLTGLILSPDPIPSVEWLPLVWTGGDPAGDSAIFTDAREAEWYQALVFDHHDAIIGALGKGRGRYRPLFDEDVPAGEILWEIWIEGFQIAMAIRPSGWAGLHDRRDAAVDEALAGIMTLIQIARDESDLKREAIDTLTKTAHHSIPGWIETLYGLKTAQASALPLASRDETAPVKIGRNDPCSCGSGRKYKKCCGAH